MKSQRGISVGLQPKLDPKKRNQFSEYLPVIIFALVSFAFSYLAINLFSIRAFPLLLGAMVALVVLVYFSFREMSFALILWLLAMPSAFKLLGIVSMPGLPDLSVDRFLLIWIVLVFPIRLLLQGQK